MAELLALCEMATTAEGGRLSRPEAGIEGQSPSTRREVSLREREDSALILEKKLDDLTALMLAMQQELAAMRQERAAVRVTRAQEAAIRRAVQGRAAELALREGLPRRALSAAILTTVREVTGTRAIGDAPQGRYDAAIRAATTWDMTGVLRRMRRKYAEDA